MPVLIVDRADGVVRATLNRPDTKNSLNFELFDALGDLFREVKSNHDDRVLVLRGANGEFCSGIDISDAEWLISTGSGMGEHVDRVNATAIALHELSKPSIAVVDGYAVGAGMALALGCDLIIASEKARFGAVYIRRSLSIDFGLSWLLPRLAGLARAKEISLLGDLISADQAFEFGLIARVVHSADLDEHADETAKRLAGSSALAIEGDLRLLRLADSMPFEDLVREEGVTQIANFHTQDVATSLARFLAKREVDKRD